MNSRTNSTQDDNRAGKQGKDEGTLEKVARFIDPPGREISDEELSDPGANIPSPAPGKAQPGRKASGNKPEQDR